MKIKILTITALVGAALLFSTASSCQRVDPCTTLAPPTPVELSAARAGADIEREVEDVECDLEGGAWVQDIDSSAKKTTKTTKATKTKTPKATAKP